ncbi:hypothetical protein T07_6494 [Trichinella nelsoni]|uniref:Uncharacterized protein n=1 Tax=Trichinella nelsoni TaxID=6336 RepID=A0A0V0RW77_9BILA|nr:hypothetical protein T07_6494 [Trichinella nelsoni]
MTKTMDARTVTVHPHNTVMNRNDPAHRECDRRCRACVRAMHNRCLSSICTCELRAHFCLSVIFSAHALSSCAGDRRKLTVVPAMQEESIRICSTNSFLASCVLIVVAYNQRTRNAMHINNNGR